MATEQASDATLRRHGLEPDPVIEFYKRGVDRSRLRQNLIRSVDERLAQLVEMQRLHEEARRAGDSLRRSR